VQAGFHPPTAFGPSLKARPERSRDRGNDPLVRQRERETTMAKMAMAQAVLNHAQDYYDTGSWYVIAECWDTLSILEELHQVEERGDACFDFDAAAIAYFSEMIHGRESSPRW